MGQQSRPYCRPYCSKLKATHLEWISVQVAICGISNGIQDWPELIGRWQGRAAVVGKDLKLKDEPFSLR